MIREHDSVVLTEDLPEERLKSGDMGVIVHVHRGGEAFEVEFITLAGESIAIATLAPRQIRAIASGDLAHVRELRAT